MSLRIGASIGASMARRSLENTSEDLRSTFGRLASGLRIQTAADDAAGLGVSERMRARARSLESAGRNAANGIDLVRSAEGVLGELSSVVLRIRELSVQNYTEVIAYEDRLVLQGEFDGLVEDFARTIEGAEFNAIQLFDADKTIGIQIGTDAGATVDVELSDHTDIAADLATGTMLTREGTEAIQAFADAALDELSSARANLGISETMLRSALREIDSSYVNLRASESRIRDADFAVESASLARLQLLQRAGASVLAQANVQAGVALELLAATPVPALAGAGNGGRGSLDLGLITITPSSSSIPGGGVLLGARG